MSSTVLLDLFTDPRTIETLSRGDKMMASMYVIVLGLGATFLVLSLLSMLTSLMSRTVARLIVEKEPIEPILENQRQADDEDEIAAVIAAAIAAYKNRN